MMHLRTFIFIHLENEIDMLVFQTLSEDDLRTIGIESFGVRRKLSLFVQRMKSPPIETLTPCDITMPETTQNSVCHLYSEYNENPPCIFSAELLNVKSSAILFFKLAD